MRSKITTTLAVGLLMMAMAGCGGGGGGRGVAVDSSGGATGAVALRGTVYAPADADLNVSRTAGRQAALSKSWRGQSVSSAQVTLNQMQKDGTLEEILNASTTTDSNGNYVINCDCTQGNYVVVANKNANVLGSVKTMFIKKMVSLAEEDITSGGTTGIDLDAASTLAVQALKDIIEAMNTGKSVGDQVDGDALAPETIEDIENELDAALAADQGSGAPVVDPLDAITNGNSGSQGELQKLENSANGAGLKNKKENASDKSKVRIKVVATPGGPVEGATVTLTVDGVTYTEITNEKGEAFFGALDPDSNFNVHVTKEGYEMKGTSGNVGSANTINNIVVNTVPITTNQAPVALAGPDQTVLEGAAVTLDGSNSFDPDGDTITYSWTQISGPSVSVSGLDTVGPTFTPTTAGTYVFGLTVNDGEFDSAQDTVTITVADVVCTTDADCDDSTALTLDSCTNPGTATAACVNTPIVCNVDADCTTGTPYCLDGGTVNSLCYICNTDADCDDGNDLTLDSCSNPGTAGSFCSHNGIVCNSDADCSGATPYCINDGTTSSACIECETDTQCDDTNDYTLDACSSAGTTSSDCTYTQVACLTDTDCDDTDDYTIDTCDNPGTAAAACSFQDVACLTDTDCDDSSAYTVDTCDNPGTASAACSYQDIACLSDTDCDDSSDYTLDTCILPGDTSSYCDYQDITCLTDTDCDDSDAATTDVCENAGTVASSCYNYKSLDWVNVAAGSFTMGCDSCFDDEAPKHTPNISAYDMLRYEVTNAQYAECVDDGTCTAPAYNSSRLVSSYYGNHDYADFPVVYVDWSQADTFCQWAGGRLATEAEWEKAARGPDTSEIIYPWGDTAPTCTEANGKISSVNCVGDTVEVGSYTGGASYYGIMDMSGNVAEWVNDWYNPLYYSSSPTDDPTGPTSGSVKVVRGGNWGSNEDLLRILTRSVSLPTSASNSIGVRCVRDAI